MLKNLASSAHELDEWLHQHVGRAYVAILTWGLVLSMIGSITTLGHALSAGEGGLTPFVVLVFQAGLLVNQLAQWHELRERRRLRKEAAPLTTPARGQSWSGSGTEDAIAPARGPGQTARVQEE